MDQPPPLPPKKYDPHSSQAEKSPAAKRSGESSSFAAKTPANRPAAGTSPFAAKTAARRTDDASGYATKAPPAKQESPTGFAAKTAATRPHDASSVSAKAPPAKHADDDHAHRPADAHQETSPPLPNRKVEVRDQDEKLRHRAHFEDGELHGRVESFDALGRKEQQAQYEHGLRHGDAEYRFRDYGRGVYFAERATYSDAYSHRLSDGTRCMFLAQVLCGAVKAYGTTRASGLTRPPEMPDEPNRRYHSISGGPWEQGSPTASTMFVIYNLAQAYPQFLITYKP